MDEHTTMLPVISMTDPQANSRRPTDLHWRRVLVALAAAPLLGAATLTWAVDFLDGIFSADEDSIGWYGFMSLLGIPSLWALVSGLCYLQIVTRARGMIARYECLLLGCGSAFLTPSVIMLCSYLFQGRIPQVDWRDLQFAAIFGLIAQPFGLFGGWVLWRFGVRPATRSSTDVARVFD